MSKERLRRIGWVVVAVGGGLLLLNTFTGLGTILLVGGGSTILLAWGKDKG